MESGQIYWTGQNKSLGVLHRNHPARETGEKKKAQQMKILTRPKQLTSVKMTERDCARPCRAQALHVNTHISERRHRNRGDKGRLRTRPPLFPVIDGPACGARRQITSWGVVGVTNHRLCSIITDTLQHIIWEIQLKESKTNSCALKNL